jgi:Ca2+-binding RTX toxin-like protein
MADYSLLVDRDSGTFEMYVTYNIPGYNDPETGEQFYETSWSYNFADQNGGGGTGGNGWESETVTIYMGFPSGEEVSDGNLSFVAQNTFSGVTDSLSIHILNAGYAQGDKVIVGLEERDIILSGYGADILRGNGGNDLLDSGDGDDILEGGDGADLIYGGHGDDIMRGGAGNDFYDVGSAGDVIVEAANGGYDWVLSSVDYTLSAHVEGLVLQGGALRGAGNAQNNRIDGSAAANVLDGNGGDDELYGYNGDDILRGGDGNDRMDGGAGVDTMAGGLGNDSYTVDSRSDRIIERAGEGVDEVRTALSNYTLGANLEKLTNIGGAERFRGIGNELANVMSGASHIDILQGLAGDDRLLGYDGDDILEGGAGADRLYGGNGVDTATYAHATAGVTVDLLRGGTAGEATGDSFVSVENVIGSAYADTLIGDIANNRLEGGAGDDILRGGAGNDWLVGGPGADRLEGGAGNDGVSYAASSAGVTVNLLTQTASGGDATGDILVSIAHAEGSAFADILTGDAQANLLIGGDGIDTINGREGNDTVRGGKGADTMVGSAGIDTLDYAGSADGVTVNLLTQTASGGDAQGDVFTGFERVTGSGQADMLTGDAGANILNGGKGDDILSGGDGNDTIIGGAGGDSMTGGAGSDTLSYQGSTGNLSIYLDGSYIWGLDAFGDTFSGFENLRGGEASDVLHGDSNNNSIWGGGGGDYIVGGAGSDRLYGEGGDDAFYFGAGSDIDRVIGFLPGGGWEDRIILDTNLGYSTFESVMAIGVMQGDDAVFDFGGGQRLVLEGVALSSLTAQDIILYTPEM